MVSQATSTPLLTPMSPQDDIADPDHGASAPSHVGHRSRSRSPCDLRTHPQDDFKDYNNDEEEYEEG